MILMQLQQNLCMLIPMEVKDLMKATYVEEVYAFNEIVCEKVSCGLIPEVSGSGLEEHYIGGSTMYLCQTACGI